MEGNPVPFNGFVAMDLFSIDGPHMRGSLKMVRFYSVLCHCTLSTGRKQKIDCSVVNVSFCCVYCRSKY